MNEVETAEIYKSLMSAFLDKGFAFHYFYQKGGDSSCVYIFRFQKGADYFDLREVSGGNELNFVVYVNGAFAFPSLKKIYKKQFTLFRVKHLFQKPGAKDRRAFVVNLLCERLAQSESEFFGIPL